MRGDAQPRGVHSSPCVMQTLQSDLTVICLLAFRGRNQPERRAPTSVCSAPGFRGKRHPAGCTSNRQKPTIQQNANQNTHRKRFPPQETKAPHEEDAIERGDAPTTDLSVSVLSPTPLVTVPCCYSHTHAHVLLAIRLTPPRRCPSGPRR